MKRGASIAVGAVLLLGVSGYVWNRYPLSGPVTYADETEHFKYGSIGGDASNGLPLEVMRVLPRAFPEYLPISAKGAKDYTAFGFMQEPGHDMPVGFSLRKRGIPRVGFNCAMCHVGSWRATESEPQTLLLGMGAAQLDLGAFFQFLFSCAADDRFTADYLVPLMRENGLDAADRVLYSRFVIPGMKKALLERKVMFAPLFSKERAPFGHGRVDTFNPYKLNQLVEHYKEGIPEGEKIGTADFASIWNQKIRVGFSLNWDGNAPRKKDRDMGAAFGAGATRESIDPAAIERVSQFLITLPAPAYPYGITHDTAQLKRGERTYQQYCASCHAVGGARVGKVEPLEAIRTDPNRLHSYTDKLNRLLLDYGEGYAWKLDDMAKTNGYANAPLDGVWARAPYLHNGSVPTLWDLLTPEDKRNGGKTTFYTGHTLYDTINVGIRTDVAESPDGRRATLFDIAQQGNGNKGHSGRYYGTELSDADKRALIEYMKTIR